MHDLLLSPYYEPLVGGDYQSIVDQAVDRAKAAPQLIDVPWIVGALAYLGRTREAEGLFIAHADRLPPPLRIASRFFLGVATCREGNFQSSRKAFIENIREARKQPHPLSNFFASQGMAFSRYLSGRLQKAHFWAEAAIKEASAASFPYGLVLSFELMAHVQLSSGQFHAGFRHLQLAKDKAALLGQGAVLQAIEISKVLYRASYGIAPHSDSLVEMLEAFIGNEQYEDSYTQASLNLELARVLLLRGEWNRAKDQLELSSALVYKIDNTTLEIDYNLHLAQLLRNQGEIHHALSIVRAAKHRVGTGADKRSLLKVLGFESQLLKTLGRLPEYEATLPTLTRLSKICGGHVAERYLHRNNLEPNPMIRPGEDVLGDLIDRAVQFSDGVVRDLLRSGWFGLLLGPLNIQAAEQVIYFDAEPGTLTIFDRGNVLHVSEGCSQHMRRFLTLLSEGPSSKEAIANHIWRQSYSPLRHDGSIYALVAKARKLLGASGVWIEAYELGYRLRSGVRLASLLPLEREKPAGVSSSSAPEAEVSKVLLNVRQQAILEAMQLVEQVEPGELVRKMGVSDATISRDMTYLVDSGLITKMGRGRATRYALELKPTKES